MQIKKLIPWWSKIGLKLAMARVPLGYKLWSALGVFVHGAMKDPEYAFSVFERHFKIAQPKPGFVTLELGPGDSLFSSLLTPAFGGSRTILVDVGAFAAQDLQPYRNLANYLSKRGLKYPVIDQVSNLSDLLKVCQAEYLTAGLASLRQLPDASVDFIWSQAVLEHVRKAEFLDTLKELRRVLKPDGCCSHEVDLKDHLEQSLNNLRFSESLWESDSFANSGFYTNRIRFPQMMELFRLAGFDPQVVDTKQWSQLPLDRSKLHRDFQHLSDADLLVSSFTVKLVPIVR